MGLRMTEQIRKLGKFFLYEPTPLISVLGGSITSFCIRDSLLLFNSMMDMRVNTFVAGGALALYFLKVLGVHLGALDELIDMGFIDTCKELMLKAHERKIKLILPSDFVVVEKPNMG
jgi:3-phosphoglycerate kinase